MKKFLKGLLSVILCLLLTAGIIASVAAYLARDYSKEEKIRSYLSDISISEESLHLQHLEDAEEADVGQILWENINEISAQALSLAGYEAMMCSAEAMTATGEYVKENNTFETFDPLIKYMADSYVAYALKMGFIRNANIRVVTVNGYRTYRQPQFLYDTIYPKLEKAVNELKDSGKLFIDLNIDGETRLTTAVLAGKQAADVQNELYTFVEDFTDSLYRDYLYDVIRNALQITESYEIPDREDFSEALRPAFVSVLHENRLNDEFLSNENANGRLESSIDNIYQKVRPLFADMGNLTQNEQVRKAADYLRSGKMLLFLGIGCAVLTLLLFALNWRNGFLFTGIALLLSGALLKVVPYRSVVITDGISEVNFTAQLRDLLIRIIQELLERISTIGVYVLLAAAACFVLEVIISAVGKKKAE